MEKRAFLAILFSIAVIVIYSSFLPKPQPIVEKEVMSTASDDSLDSRQFEQAALSTEEAITVLEDGATSVEYYSMTTDKFELTFSSPGGNIEEIYLKDYDTRILGSQFLAVEEFNKLPFSFKVFGNKATLSYEGPDLKIDKTYSFSPDSYLINWELKITNLSDQIKAQNLHITNSFLDLSKLSQAKGFRNQGHFNEFSVSLQDKVLRVNINRINQKKKVAVAALVNWMGIRDRYFCSILKPLEPVKGYFTQPLDTKQVITGIQSEFSIFPNSSYTFDAGFYAGPQDTSILKAYNLGLENIVNFGFFSPISQIIIQVLKLSYKVVRNWGVSIIFLSILISIVLYPFTFKSLKSMKDMQMLQPEMERLRKAYKDQPQKLNQAILELYKEHKVNPFGGCLPLFLQFPIFISLYQALMRSIELRGAGFLWIKDLSHPDRLFTWSESRSLPVIGNEFNLLPILMLVAMLVQQKMSSRGNPSTSPEQQKLMMILMPILFGFIFYHFPSGLTLYWTCYTIISLVFQKKLLYAKSESHIKKD